jgi:hypothetical protein
MDGVIANFTKQACKYMGEPYPATEELADYGWLFDKHGREKCYARLRGHLLWTSIEKFPWADRIIDIVDTESRGDWIFLTKPMIDPYCYSGKAEWMMKHYKQHLKKLTIIAEDKARLVRDSKDVLIDDHPKNVASWRMAGGTPYYWTEVGDQYNPQMIEERLNNLRQTLIQIRES